MLLQVSQWCGTIDEEVGTILESLGILADDVVQAEIQLIVSKHLFCLYSSCWIIICLLTDTYVTFSVSCAASQYSQHWKYIMEDPAFFLQNHLYCDLDKVHVDLLKF